MEYGLGEPIKPWASHTIALVLILVVMEYGLGDVVKKAAEDAIEKS